MRQVNSPFFASETWYLRVVDAARAIIETGNVWPDNAARKNFFWDKYGRIHPDLYRFVMQIPDFGDPSADGAGASPGTASHTLSPWREPVSQPRAERSHIARYRQDGVHPDSKRRQSALRANGGCRYICDT